jgi:hypothetical protein
MLNNLLAEFYEKDLNKLLEEVNLFQNEGDLWKTTGTVKNSCGNLVLHIVGGLNHYVGATLAHTLYIRNRDEEFSRKGVSRKELVEQLEKLVPLVKQTVSALTQKDMEAEFPIFFDKPKTTTAYVLIRLLAHLDYHLGQVNYLRRILEQ